MVTKIAVQVTPQGLLIPRDAVGDWYTRELEAVLEQRKIVIRPKTTSSDERTRTAEVLREAGMMYEPHWEAPSYVSPEERRRLAKELGEGQPLSEVIIADREDRA